jgi:hypothetical protein
MTRRLARHSLDILSGRRQNYGVPGAETNAGVSACPHVTTWEGTGSPAEARGAKAGAEKNTGDWLCPFSAAAA